MMIIIRSNPTDNVLRELKKSHCFKNEKRRALTKPEQELFLDYLKNTPESVLSEKGSDFSIKTAVHIHRLFEKLGFDEVFGRSAVMELLELKGSGASKLLSNLVKADIIEPVSGHGKGKYKFKK